MYPPHDREDCPDPTFQPRTLEVMHFLGILPEILQRGDLLIPMKAYKPGEREPFKTVKMMEDTDPTPSTPWVIFRYFVLTAV